MSKNFVVYTAITNNKDILKENQCTLDADFFAFLDTPQKSETWTIREASSEFADPRRNAKVQKILSHHYFPDYEYSLWIDGAVELQVPVGTLVEKYLKDADIAFFKHPVRNCLYKEAEVCKELKLDDPEIIDKQMKKYRSESFPEEFGLAEATVLLRRHTPKVKEFNELWWKEIKYGSRRDQLSMFYALWKTGLKYTFFPGQVQNDPKDPLKNGNPYTKWYKHTYFKDEDFISIQH